MKIIVAIDRNGAIGRDGGLLFNIRADLRRFKALTTGHTVVMGRKTFESLPKGALPDRRNIVVSRTPGYQAPGAEVFGSLEEALAACASDETFVIGGAQLYEASLPLADTLLLTVVDACGENPDTFFPVIPLESFRVESIEIPETEPACKYVTLKRI